MPGNNFIMFYLEQNYTLVPFLGNKINWIKEKDFFT